MEQMRPTWTDSRLDDLRQDVKGEFAWVRTELSRQGDRIDAMNHTIVVVGGSVLAAIIGMIAVMVGILFTQL